MEMRKRVLGQEHPDTLASMNDVALAYSKQNRLKEAEELYAEVMESIQRSTQILWKA